MTDWIFNDGLGTPWTNVWNTPTVLHEVSAALDAAGRHDLSAALNAAAQHDPSDLSNTLDNSPQYLLDDDGHLTIVSDAKGGTHGPSSGSTSTSTSGTSTSGTTTTTTVTSPPPGTIVGSSTGLQFDLIWDSSVLNASNAAAIEQTVITAAQILASSFTTHVMLNIHVGLNEVGGTAMGSGMLGESETAGFSVSYGTLTNALGAADAGLVSSGLMSSNAVTAISALAGKAFFLPAAEAKALGLSSATSSSVDGYIGLSGSAGLSFTGVVGTGQYDGVGIAVHELSEVMGRLASEGSLSGYYLPLDLFRYSAANTPSLSTTSGYFSTNLGVTASNYYNSSSNGGDAGDWATSAANAYDAFDAFSYKGAAMRLSTADLLEVAALGYHPAGALAPVTA